MKVAGEVVTVKTLSMKVAGEVQGVPKKTTFSATFCGTNGCSFGNPVVTANILRMKVAGDVVTNNTLPMKLAGEVVTDNTLPINVAGEVVW